MNYIIQLSLWYVVLNSHLKKLIVIQDRSREFDELTYIDDVEYAKMRFRVIYYIRTFPNLTDF